MHLRSAAISLLAAVTSVMAQLPPPETSDAAREAALDTLLSERESFTALESAIIAARKSRVSEQAILEARFLYHVDRREDGMIAAMLPEFQKQRDVFKLEDSAIFGVREDWLAVIEYVTAIAALEKGDKDAFKQHITEAFWLGPRQAAAFAPHIERMRLEEAMRSVKIDFTATFPPVDGGPPVALEKFMAGRKAMLLHFWSPASRECEAAMPDFVKTAASLASNEIAVVSMVPAGSAETLADARKLVLPHADKPVGAWLGDSPDKALGRELRIHNLPTMVLVSKEGRVLFNGDPTDEQFWDALRKLDARITRPESPGDDAE